MKVEVCFFADRYRKKSPPFGNFYRSHFVIKGERELLEIQFVNLPPKPYGERITCEIVLLFHSVDYSKLIKGASFEIREGPHIVGEGVVLTH